MITWAKSYFLGLFFHPDNIRADDPTLMKIPHEEVRFSTLDGRVLRGYFFKSRGPSKGTIVHCHGNTGNITSHYSLVLFLVREGYGVLVFDYGGYGESEGKPSPESIVQDAQTAVAYARSRPDVDANKIALFGQSLGGAAAAAAMARDKNVRCLILEGTFTTFREMAFATYIGKFLFFLTPFVIPDVGPGKDLPLIAPRPVLIIHGENDSVIPARFGPALFKIASDKKYMSILKAFDHLQGDDGMPDYRAAIFQFLKAHLD